MYTKSSSCPPKPAPIKYDTPLGTRWEKEKAASGGAAAFDLPTDPKHVGPWILGECIGRGASGRVKIAKHCNTGQFAAVKILSIAPLATSRASIDIDPDNAMKVRLGIDREITMMKLMNHPNILRIYDVYEGEHELFLVLEYIEGGELFDFLVNHGRLPPAEALVYFKQIIYGLNYAHTFSIIHRDLKPENILIASLCPPIIKIADWGMAAFAPPHLQLETSCGSPHYASPEIVNGERYSGNTTDIWSCGIILFALLIGRLPFDDKNVRNLLAKVKAGRYEIPPWVDPLAQDLIQRMLVVEVSERITIPEILAHPWLQSAELAAIMSLSTPTVRQNPSLPPSPSTLARPVAPKDIDPELFASLRIIWGRHADTLGKSIKRDLCSPQGQGVHAKVFYLLLMQYREERKKSQAASVSWRNISPPSPGPPVLKTMKFDRDWKLSDTLDHVQDTDPRGTARSSEKGRPNRTSRMAALILPAANTEQDPYPRDDLPSSLRSKKPLNSRKPRSILPNDNINVSPPSAVLDSIGPRKPSPSSSSSTGGSPNLDYPPSLPHRGCSYHVSKGDGRLDLQILARRSAIASTKDVRRPSPSPITPNPPPRRASHRIQSGASRAFLSYLKEKPTPYTPLPLRRKRFSGDDKESRASSHGSSHDHSGIRHPQSLDISPSPPSIPTTVIKPTTKYSDKVSKAYNRRLSSKAELHNKENITPGTDRRTSGLGIGRGVVGREMGNVIRIGGGSEPKDRVVTGSSAKSEPVAHPLLKHKWSTIASPPILSSSQSRVSKAPTPVVGWLSSLFGRTSTAGYLYSPLNVSGSQRIIESILTEKGVSLHTSRIVDHIVIKGSIEHSAFDRHTSLSSLKAVNLHIEILPAATNRLPALASENSLSPAALGSPLYSPHVGEFPLPQERVPSSRSSFLVSAPIGNIRIHPSEIPPGAASVVVMSKDKGSSTSFHLLWECIKDTLDNIADRSKSSTTSNTTIIDGEVFVMV